ncbi:MAG: cell division protein ZapA [Gammaproteobacteria bacterium]|nr:cell division protein ZapA [Gammaproteobacteria bacterium]MDH5593999.1 cell division protein ZapA [Gammaproteobacteria bacterium]MDH5613409.1 cell division protein ZapA [Gammaproteobacteria bacterium]
MSKDVSPVTINILDKEYVISCPSDEEKDLLAAAQMLNQKMKDLRQGGKVIGAERIAVMAGLNLAHEMIKQQSGRNDVNKGISTRIQMLQNKVESALGNYRQMELSS